MAQAVWFRSCLVAAIASMPTLTLVAQGDPAAIQQKLSAQFKLTRITADRSDIVTAGDIVVIHKPGLLMYAVASPLPPSNTYKNGKIGQGMGGFGKDLMIGMVTPGAGTAADYPHRPFVPDEKCWVTGIQVEKDGVLFQLYSDPYDDVRYYANLKVPFPNKKEIPSPDVALQTVAEVLTVVPQDDQGGQGGSADQGAQQAAFSGQYANLNPRSTERFIFLPDGSFTKIVGNGQGHGQFSLNGDTLTLTFTSTGASFQFKIQGDKLFNPDTRQTFARTGDAPDSASAPDTGSTPGGQQPTIPGQYSAAGGSRLLLLPDGSFTKFVAGGQGRGQYAASGDDLTLTFTSTGFSQHFKIQSGNLLDVNTHQEWARTGDAPAAPLPEIAPPPPPADAPPPTIGIGQTMNQVTAGFGQPLRVANLGGKVVFFYKDMKVTFSSGKVSDVE
jgi:hypothetical protein